MGRCGFRGPHHRRRRAKPETGSVTARVPETDSPAELTERFDRATASLSEEIRHLHQRVGELEAHAINQGDVVQELSNAVDSRDTRIVRLEDEMEEQRPAAAAFLSSTGPASQLHPMRSPGRRTWGLQPRPCSPSTCRRCS